MQHLRFIILSIFILPSTFVCAQESSSFVDDFSKRWQNARQYTTKVAEQMPEAQYGYQPSREEMTFGEQVKHLSSNITYLSFAYLSPVDSTKAKEVLANIRKAKNKASILEGLQDAFDFMESLLQKYDEKMLEQEVNFFAGKMSQRRIFFLIIDHLAHHRGQLIVYLRLNGLKPPRYTGW